MIKSKNISRMDIMVTLPCHWNIEADRSTYPSPENYDFPCQHMHANQIFIKIFI